MMEESNPEPDRLRPDERRAAVNQAGSETSASNTNIRDEGLTILSDGVNPVADIVFIHGIQGHPRKTWTYAPDHGKLKSKITKYFDRKKNSSDASELDSYQDSVYWPQDLLSKDFEDVRIMTYGYDSHVSRFFRGPANRNNINGHGRSLLNALELFRRQDPKRRLIFIVHSLGGLILKEALRQSWRSSEDNQDLRNIYQSLHAIVFFGTPHRGSPYAEAGITAQQITKAVGFDANDALLRNLRPDGEYLGLLREEFKDMLDERTFKVFSFQEGQGFKSTRTLARKIVDDASSSLDHPIERRDSINANHVMMCRFKSFDDDGYIKVKGVVSKYLAEIRETQHREQQKLDQEHRKLLSECLESLKTVAMRERQNEIEDAHPHTFEWAFSDPGAGIFDWLRGDSGLFWIRGKPASGKSTLMKYILEDDRTLEVLRGKYGQDSVTMPGFFFHNRGANLTQKSLDGLLRSILFQILSDLPTLIDCIAEVYRNAMDLQGRCAWQFAELKKALNSIVKQKKVSGCIMLFIDALDEFVGTDIEIARFLNDLLYHESQQALRIRICASSRPHNVFYDMFGEYPSLTIHDWTQDDISNYTSDRLRECKREGLHVLHEEITSRAQGVFLWVKLVIEELSEPLFNGGSIPLLVERLSRLPNDLAAFYRFLVKRIPPDKRSVTQKMLELVLCNQNRMSLVTFTAAINLLGQGISMTDRLKQGPFDILRSCEEMVRQIRGCGGGLLEVVQSRVESESRVPQWLYEPLQWSQYVFTRQHVQLLHQTAKDFVNDPSNSDLMNGNSAIESALAGHLQIMELCICIARTRQPSLWSNYGSHHPPEKRPQRYGVQHTDAISCFYYNARAAEHISGKPSVELVTEFHDTLYSIEGSRWALELLERDANNYGIPPAKFFSQIPYEPLTIPLAFAIVQGLHYYVQEILFSGHYGLLEKNQLGLLLYCVFGLHLLGLPQNTPNFMFKPNQLFVLLLENGADPNMKVRIRYTKYFSSAKEAEAQVKTGEGNPKSITSDEKMLLGERAKRHYGFERSQRVNRSDNEIVADADSSSRSHETSDVLTESDIFHRVRVRTDMEMSVLHYALGSDLLHIRGPEDNIALLENIRLLVHYGADVNEMPLDTFWVEEYNTQISRLPASQSALHYLIRWHRIFLNPFEATSGPARARLIMTFLEHGADPNAVDSHGTSILELALRDCPYEVIELLLDKGAKITPRLVSMSGVPKYQFHSYLETSDNETEEDLEFPSVLASHILNEMRWRRPECYTDEARELARPHNPHWAELEHKEKTTGNMSLASRLRALVGFS